jgi:hypothetical protein
MIKKPFFWVVMFGLLAGLMLILGQGTAKKPIRKSNWTRTLNFEGQGPYDLGLFAKTLQHNWDNLYLKTGLVDTVGNALDKLKNKDPKGVYMYVGKYLYLSKQEADALWDFVYKGGTVFISAEAFPESLLQRFPALNNLEITSIESDSFFVDFTHPFMEKSNFSFLFYKINKPTPGNWFQFRNKLVNEEKSKEEIENAQQQLTVITETNGKTADYIYASQGEGKIYLHANPVLFSNYYMKSAEGRRYLKNVIQHIPHQYLVFHTAAGFPRAQAFTGTMNRPVFEFIQKNESLYIAWWILVGAGLLFLITGGKRKNRPIPVIASPKNNSVDLIKTISAFYFRENNHKQIVQMEWNQFLYFTRNTLRIHGANEHFPIDLIALKSGAPEADIQFIFNTYNTYNSQPKVSQKQLIVFSSLLAKFYKNYSKKST